MSERSSDLSGLVAGVASQSGELPPSPLRPARILVLTADAPFFPGKMGLDFFNLRHLARRHRVGVVAPNYPQLPQAGIENLKRSVQATYLWPEALPDLPPSPAVGEGLKLRRYVRALPRAVRRFMLQRLLGLPAGDEAGLLKLAILANLAPYLLKALAECDWDGLVIVQSDTQPWLPYLPPHLPLAVYFHDVRADYLERRARFEGPGFLRLARRAARQERDLCRRAEAVGFVSELDRSRAQQRYGPLGQALVAPIAIDLDYYQPRPPGFVRDARPLVLFTGHLLHPPNVDAALFFLREVWPLVQQRRPDAVFQLAGMLPAPELKSACEGRADVELHPDVPDIRPFFWNAAAYVVPMRFGGGVRQKVLEAWAMQVPVVLTPMAAEGSPARDGANCLMAEQPEALASSLIDLLAHPGRAAELAASAREEVRTHHALAVACPAFEELALRAPAVRRGRPFRLLFDLTWLEPGDDSTAAGYARALIGELALLDTRHEWRVLAPAASLRELRLPRSPRWRRLPTDGWWLRSRRLKGALVNLLGASLQTHRPATQPMRRLEFLHHLDCDLVHAFEPARPRETALLPSVVSIFEALPALEAAEWERRARSECARARRVLCPSEAARAALHARFELPLERLLVVPPASKPGETAAPFTWREHALRALSAYEAAYRDG